ncbi:hypothetical protein UlMin_005176 [Ulmus minor]
MASHSLVLRSAAMGSGGHVTVLEARWWVIQIHGRILIGVGLSQMGMTLDSNGLVKRFHEMKTKWGFAQLLSHVTFKYPLSRYLIDDCFVVGAEVFIIKQSYNFEFISLVKSPYVSGATFTWTLDKFSSLNNEYYRSKVFSARQKNWDLMVFPYGDFIEKDKLISIFLEPVDWESKAAVFTKYNICVINQVNGKHLDGSDDHSITLHRLSEYNPPISHEFYCVGVFNIDENLHNILILLIIQFVKKL